MRINEESINHNVARLIGEIVEDLNDLTDADKDMDHARIAMLGEIRGICQMAQTMKEVLNA